jgi:hypothetical protein
MNRVLMVPLAHLEKATLSSAEGVRVAKRGLIRSVVT